MKIKLLLTVFAAFTVSNSYGAIYVVSNLVSGGGVSDTLFQSSGALNAPLLNGGVVALGYFPSNSYVPSNSLQSISTTISDFTIVAFSITGSPSAQLMGPGAAGYVDASPFDTANLAAGDSLIGRSLFVFVGNSSTLLTSDAFALKQIGLLADDTASENQYLANPKGGADPVIGSINLGAFTGNPLPATSVGTTTFDTLQLVAVPEPSALLLSSLGLIGLLRRKR